MRATARHHELRIEDYFAAERLSPSRHEFADGQIYLMAGGPPRHNWLETRVLQVLGARLRGEACFAMTSNQRIATPDGLHTYADGSVYCGDMEVGPEQTATNPVVLVEILSDSTRAYDRGEKLERYKSIPTLRHVLLIDQHAVDVEHWSRGPGGWTRTVLVDRADVVRLDITERASGRDRIGRDSTSIELPLSEIYEGIERFPTH